MSTIVVSGWMLSTTPCMMPTKGSLRPKSVVKVTTRLSDMHSHGSRGRDGSQGPGCLPGPHTQNQAGGELQSVLVVNAVQIVRPRMRVVEAGHAEGQSAVDLVVQPASHGDREAAGVPILGVERMLGVAKPLGCDFGDDGGPFFRIQAFQRE